MAIISINGKIGSGKDTVGKIIQNFLKLEKGEDWEIKKFATKLKLIASILTGKKIESFEDQDFKKSFLPSEWDTFTYEVNADSLAVIENKMTVRELLQKIGTDCMRDFLHQNVWINALFCDYIELDGKYPNWIITDLRFLNELKEIKKRNKEKSFIVKVERNNLETKSEHISETALDQYENEFDYIIKNNGTKEDLVKEVKQMLINFNLL